MATAANISWGCIAASNAKYVITIHNNFHLRWILPFKNVFAILSYLSNGKVMK